MHTRVALLLCTLEILATVPGMATATVADGFAQTPARQTSAAQCDATADPAAVVLHGDARFTVLSPSLIRIEAAPLDDRCSFTVVSRRWTAVPPFSRIVHPNGQSFCVCLDFLLSELFIFRSFNF